MNADRKALLDRARQLQADLHVAAQRADAVGEEEDADRLWQAHSQSGDVVEELMGTY